MRGVSILLIVLLTGCISNAATPPEQPAHAAMPIASAPATHVAGTKFLEPSRQAPARAEIPFQVNTSRAEVVSKVHLGTRYGTDLVLTTARATVQLVGPSNATLAQATLQAGTPDATLRAAANATGTHKLVLLSYGGSDGSSMGDYVAYVIDAEATT